MTAETTLRQAAALMRSRAEVATPGVWEATVFGVHARDGMARLAVAGWDTQTETPQMPDRLHIASWHPAVALAVADLLEAADANYDPEFPGDCEDWEFYRAAKRLATAYLGATP